MQTIINKIHGFLEMLFPWNNNANSKDCAKSRLKLIIAHDRASINSDLLTAMREEILDVVARYVEVNRDEMEFSLSNDQRTTSLTANLPIRQIKRLGELQQQLKENHGIELQKVEAVDAEENAENANSTSRS